MSGYALLVRLDELRAEHASVAPFSVGDDRLLPTLATASGRLLVAGQVRLDDRENLVRAIAREHGRARDAASDIDLFALAWEAWGEQALERIIGDFSVAIVDGTERTVTLARDAFGVRMLFYTLNAERLFVSNRLSGVLAAPGVSRALNEDAIADYIAAGLNKNLATTTYRDVLRVPPGHLLRVRPWQPAVLARYWSFPDVPERALATPRDYADGFRDVLAKSVRDRMRAPSVSVLMSGGLDSTSLAAIASDQSSAGCVHAVTIDMPTLAPSGDAPRARAVAAHLGIAHTIVDGDAFGYREGVEGASHHRTPEPYDDPDLDGWIALLRAASGRSPVVLYGEDPDSLLLPSTFGEMRRAQGAWRTGVRVVSYLAREGRRPHLGLRHAETGASHDSGHSRPRVVARFADPLWQSTLESLDAGFHGVPVDVRLPYLDRRVVEFALAAPPIPWAQQKRLLREAVRGLLPDVVLRAPKEPMAALPEARLVQWRARGPAPFNPSEQLRSFVGARQVVPGLFELRLRILDRWLQRDSDPSGC